MLSFNFTDGRKDEKYKPIHERARKKKTLLDRQFQSFFPPPGGGGRSGILEPLEEFSRELVLETFA